MTIAPHQIVCPDSNDRIVPPDDLLASEASTVAGMQLVMLETLLKRAETLRFRAFEAYFYVASESVSMLGTSDHFKESAVRSASETLQLAEYLEQTAKQMIDQIKPLAESVMAKNEASIRAKNGNKPMH